MEKSKSVTLTVAVAALLIGGIGGYAISMSKADDHSGERKTSQSSSLSTATKPADLRVLLNGLEQEHVSLASAATRAGFDGARNFDASAASLDKNSKDIQAAVASVYGDEAGQKFYGIWNSHIGFFVDYTVAAKKGDMAGMDKAVQNLNGYVDSISTFFSEANPNLPKDAVATLIGEHVTLLKAAVDNYGAGDINASYSKEREARTQIGTIADTLASAIVKQKPDSFR